MLKIFRSWLFHDVKKTKNKKQNKKKTLDEIKSLISCPRKCFDSMVDQFEDEVSENVLLACFSNVRENGATSRSVGPAVTFIMDACLKSFQTREVRAEFNRYYNELSELGLAFGYLENVFPEITCAG